MNRKTKATGEFRVLCNLCGTTIRDHNRQEASRLCLKCFYKILNDHVKAQKHTPYGKFVSDR